MANPSTPGLNPIPTYQEVYKSIPEGRLGRNELMVLYALSRSPRGIESRELYSDLCQAKARLGEKPPCINLVQQAVLSLKRKGLVIRKRKAGVFHIYLTTTGKKFVLYFTNPMLY